MRKTATERFWSKVEKTDTCWLWTASLTAGGYGQFHYGSRFTGGYQHKTAHRWAYEELVGPIPDGLQLDHLCRVTSCVNPQHLEPVTSRVNTLRSSAPSAANAVKTHCHRGHEFTPANTIVKQGKRSCRICSNAHHRSSRDRARAAAVQEQLTASFAPHLAAITALGADQIPAVQAALTAYQSVLGRVLAVSDELSSRVLDDGGSEYADGIEVAARMLRQALAPAGVRKGGVQ